MWQAIRLSIVASILLSGNLWAQDPSSSTSNPSISEANPPRQANLPIRDSLWHLTRHLYEGDTEWEEGTTPAQPLYPIKANVPGAKLGFIPRIKPAANIEQKMMEALRKNTFFDNGLSENDYQRLRKVLTPNEMAIYKWLVGLDGFYLSVLRRTKSALAGEAGYSYKNFLETMDFAALQKFVQHFLPEDKNKPPHIYYDKDLHDPLPEFLDKSRIFPQYNLTQEKVGLWVELVKRQLALTRKFYFDIVEDGLGPHGQDHYQGLPPTAEIPTSFIFSQDQNPHWTATLFARAKQEQWDLNVTAKIVQAYKDSQNAKGHPLVLPEWFSRSQAYALLKYRYLRLAALIDPKARQTLDREYPFWTIKELDASFPFLNHRLSPFDLRPNGQRPSRSTKFLDTLGRLWRGTEVQREMADQYVIKSFGPSFPILVDYLNTAIAIYQRLEVFDPAITHEMYDFILRYTAKYEPAKLYSYVSAYPHEYDAFYYSNEPFFTQLAQDLAAHPFSLAQEELSPAQVELMERLARKMDELRQRPAMPIGYITEAQLRDSIPQLLQQGIQDAEAPDMVYTVYHYYPEVGTAYFDYHYSERLRSLRQQKSAVSYTMNDVVIPGKTVTGEANEITFHNFQHFTTKDGWQVTLAEDIPADHLRSFLAHPAVARISLNEPRVTRDDLINSIKNADPSRDIIFPVTVTLSQDVAFSIYDELKLPAQLPNGKPNVITLKDVNTIITADGQEYITAHALRREWLKEKLGFSGPFNLIRFPVALQLERDLTLPVLNLTYHAPQCHQIVFPEVINYPATWANPQKYPALAPWGQVDFRHLTLAQREDLEKLKREGTLTEKRLFANLVDEIFLAIFPKGSYIYKFFLDPQLAVFMEDQLAFSHPLPGEAPIILPSLARLPLWREKIKQDKIQEEKEQQALAKAQALAAQAAARKQAEAERLRREAELAALRAKAEWEATPPAEKLAVYLQYYPELWPAVLAQINGEARVNVKSSKFNIDVAHQIDLMGELEVFGPEESKDLLSLKPMQQLLLAAIAQANTESGSTTQAKIKANIFQFLTAQRFLLGKNDAAFEASLQKLSYDEGKVIANFYEEYVLNLSSEEFKAAQPKNWNDPRYTALFSTLTTPRLMMTFGKPFKITEQNKSFLTEEILQTALAQYFSKVFWGENANANHVELLASSLQEKELVPVTRFYDLTYPGLTDNYAARVLLRKLQKSEVFDRILSILADPPTKTEFNPFTDERFKVSFTVQTDPAYPNMRQVRYLCLEITDPLVGLDKVKVIFYAQLPIPSNATLAKNQGRPIFTIVQIDKYQGTARAPRTAYLEDSLLNFIYKTTDNGKDGFQLKANFAQWLYQYLVFGTSYVDKKFKYGIYRNIGIYRYELSGLWRLAARYFSVDDPNRTDLQIMFPYGVGKHNNNNYENYDSNDTDKSIVSRAEICARSLTQEPSIERTFYLDKNGWHEQNF